MKKAANKAVLAQPAAAVPRLIARAPGPVHTGVAGEGEAYRARIRYQILLHDYKELVKETEKRKNRLHMEKLKKQKLLAEVGFLRRRYKSMSENPSRTAVYRVKNPAMMPPTSRTATWDEHRSVHAVGSSSKGLPVQQRRQHFAPRASPVIDLNEVCDLSSDEMEEAQGYQEPIKANKHLLEGGNVAAGPSDPKVPAFWDVQSSAGQAGKRKASWQDQLALRV